MESLLKTALNTPTLQAGSEVAGGIVNAGRARVYHTHTGPVFVKHNTQDVLLKHPCGVGSIVVLEYLDSLQPINEDGIWYTLGQQIAKLHNHNGELLKKMQAGEQSIHRQGDLERPVSKFGFHTDHFYGPTFFVPANSWEDTFTGYLFRHMIEPLVRNIERQHRDKEVTECWSKLQRVIDKPFQNLDIVPALIHGDLFEINVGHVGGKPVIYDPQSSYGFGEFELACDDMPEPFHNGYHSIIPQLPGHESRKKVAQLFVHLLMYDVQGPDPNTKSEALKCGSDILQEWSAKA